MDDLTRKVAAGVFIGLLAFFVLTHLPEILDTVQGGLTGWDSHAKARHQQQLDLNKQYIDRSVGR
jgi:hypothetical protein